MPPADAAPLAPHHLLVALGLSPSVEAAAEARGLLHAVLHGRDQDDIADVACLLTSELVANALVHAHTPVELVVDLTDDRLTVEVLDATSDHPVVRHAAPLDEGGRGLALVDGLADQWGVTPAAVGKAVWFRLGTGGAGAGACQTLPEASDGG